ncbi:MAG: four helix bundle protein [bacterium]
MLNFEMMKKENLIREKSFEFALLIIELYKKLTASNEFVISKQLLRSATSIGANVEEAIAGQSKNDFLYKMATASKEARETKYWLMLLDKSQIVKIDYQMYLLEIESIINILTKIVKTGSKSIQNPKSKIQNLKFKGLTLVEVLISMAVLLLGIIGVSAVIINSVRINDMAIRQTLAKETAGAEIERIKLIGYWRITQDNLRQEFGSDSLTNLEEQYQLPGIPEGVITPYNYCLFRGVDVQKEIRGRIRHYYYTLKLSVDEDFVEKYAQMLRMEVFWMFQGRLKHIEVVFVVGHRHR